MELHEKLRIIGKAFAWEKVTQGQARSAAPYITTAADRLEVLEREHAEFFERWHEHRRALEEIVRVLGPAAPTCDGCAVEIAEALKIARKVGADGTALERPNA